jgi:large subunit ribosomal protein L25
MMGARPRRIIDYFFGGLFFMGLSTTLNASAREPGSSNLAKRLRKDGLLPGILYGQGGESIPITLPYAVLRKALLTDEGNRSLFTLDVGDKGSFPILVKDYQIHPVTRKMLHVDFLKIDTEKMVSVKVPLALKGKALGVEKGGQLQQSEREITVKGLPADIPAMIEADVTPLNLGQTLHLSQVKLPENLTLVKTVDLPVAVVGIPKGLKAEDVVEAQAAPAPAGKAAPPAKAAAAPAAKAAAKPAGKSGGGKSDKKK